MDFSRALALFCVIVLLVGGLGMLAAASSYSISVTGGTDVPERTVTEDGETYVIDEIKVVEPGDGLTAQTSVPDDEFHGLNVYDNVDGSPLLSSGENGDATHSYSADEMDQVGPGTYALGLIREQELRDVYLIVVEGFEVSVSAPSEVADDEPATVQLDVEATRSSGSPDEVLLGFDVDGEDETVSATHVGDGEYEATFPADELDTGTYNLYGIALGSQSSFGEDEILGVSGSSLVEVTESDETELAVETAPAADVGAESATLTGDLTALDGMDSAEVFFEYGEAGSDMDATTGTQTLSSTGSFDAAIDGLDPDTEYEFRAVAAGEDTDAEGNVQQFTTDGGVAVETQAATAVSADSATLTGELTDLDGFDSAEVSFEYGEAGSTLDASTGSQTITAAESFEAELDGLDPDTEYEFRAVVDADEASDEGATQTFQTSADGTDDSGTADAGDDSAGDTDEPGTDDSSTADDSDTTDDSATTDDQSGDDAGSDDVQQPAVDEDDTPTAQDDADDDTVPLSLIVPVLTVVLAAAIAARRL